jgi:hypothetical protein
MQSQPEEYGRKGEPVKIGDAEFGNGMIMGRESQPDGF